MSLSLCSAAPAAPLGQITEFTAGLQPGSFANPYIAAGPDGNMWFTDRGGTKSIGRITPNRDHYRILGRSANGQCPGLYLGRP